MTPLQFIGIGKYDLFCMEQSSYVCGYVLYTIILLC